MQHIADLFPSASEARILQLAAKEMPRHPEREHSLIRLPKLPSTGNDSTAVDNSWEAKIFYVLFNKELRGAFGRTIQRPESSADHRKLLADASLTQSDLSSSSVHIKTKTGLESHSAPFLERRMEFCVSNMLLCLRLRMAYSPTHAFRLS